MLIAPDRKWLSSLQASNLYGDALPATTTAHLYSICQSSCSDSDCDLLLGFTCPPKIHQRKLARTHHHLEPAACQNQKVRPLTTRSEDFYEPRAQTLLMNAEMNLSALMLGSRRRQEVPNFVKSATYISCLLFSPPHSAEPHTKKVQTYIFWRRIFYATIKIPANFSSVLHFMAFIPCCILLIKYTKYLFSCLCGQGVFSFGGLKAVISPDLHR